MKAATMVEWKADHLVWRKVDKMADYLVESSVANWAGHLVASKELQKVAKWAVRKV